MSTNYGFEPTLDGLNNIDSDSTTTTNIVCDTITINTSGTAPTMTPGNNTTNIANTAFVTNAISSAGGSYVTLTGASQTISSEKTFSNANTFITGALNAPTIKTTLGTSMTIATDPVGYTDDIDITTANDLTLTAGFNAVLDCYNGNFNSTSAMTFASGSNINFNSTGTPGTVFNGDSIAFNNTGGSTVFNYVLPSCSIAPTTGNDLCNKTYVDSVSGASLLTSSNTFTGTTNRFQGLNGVRSGTSSNYASLTQNGGQSILNAFGSSTNVLYLQTNGSSNMTMGESGGIKYNINSGDFINTTGDFLILQSTYPSTNTSQLGYNKTETLAEFTFTADTLGTIGSFTVPSKGVWICNISVKYRTTGGAGSFENVQLFLTDSASGTTAYRTFEYFDETDIVVGANGKRFVHTISGTLNSTASQTFYIRGLNDTTGITTLAEATYTYTRVG